MRTVFLLLAAAVTLGACASGGQSVDERARAVCADRGLTPGPEFSACMDETRETLRRAQENTRARPEPRPPGS